MTTYTPNYTVGYMNGGNRRGIMCTGDLPLAMSYALELRSRGDIPYLEIDADCADCKGHGHVWGKRCPGCKGKASCVQVQAWAPCLPEPLPTPEQACALHMTAAVNAPPRGIDSLR